MAVQMTLIGEQHHLPPRIVIFTSDGALLIVDVDGFREKAIGYWKVISDVAPTYLHGRQSGDVSYAPVAVGKKRHTPTRDSAIGKLGVGKGYLTVVGFDGAARLIDTQYIIEFGELSGTVLRSRTPHSGTTPPAASGSVKQAPSAAADPQGASSAAAVSSESQWGDEFAGGNPMDKENARRNEDFVLCHSFSDENASEDGLGKSNSGAQGNKLIFTSHGVRSSSNKHPLRSQPLKAKLLVEESKRARTGGKGTDPNAPKPLSFMATSKAMSASDKIVDPLTTPLFELAHLTPKEKQVNLQKLRTFLNINGRSQVQDCLFSFVLIVCVLSSR